MPALFSLKRSSKARWAALVLALGLPALAFGQRDDAPPKEVSDRVSQQFTKLRELTDNKQYDEALTIINDLLSRAQPNTYDVVVLAQLKAQVLLTNNNYAEAIEPLETAIRLGRTHQFLEPKQIQEYTFLLAQLHYQVASAYKTVAEQQPGIDRALNYIQEYLAAAEQPNPEQQLFAAHVFYNRATLDTNNVDEQLLEEARKQAEGGLYLAIKPREAFYVLMVGVLQQQGRNQDAADLLELLVTQYPTNKQYWQSLAGAYLALAAETEDPDEIENWNIRAILTFERAQELGIMDEPSNHFNLIGLYFNIQQFDRAVELLERGLENGNVENTQRNWELLASSYQQVRKELKAIDVLNEAARRFPEAGQLEFTIAQTYYSIDKMPEAYRHVKRALEKGNLDKRSTVLMFAAYIGYELQEYQEALRFAEEAAQDPTADRVDSLVRAIREAIDAREAQLQARSF